MKIIFLDFDGVICTQQSYVDAQMKYGLTKTGFPPGLHLFKSELVARVQEICDATGAVVVISSYWRTFDELDTLRRYLKHHGLIADVIDKTPENPYWNSMGSAYRGKEIAMWMDAHPDVSYDDIVVLDDDVLGIQEDKKVYQRLVATYFMGRADEAGLQPHHVKQAIEMLTK
jgi:hypothetical protein